MLALAGLIVYLLVWTGQWMRARFEGEGHH
jgi:hypothetical protein